MEKAAKYYHQEKTLYQNKVYPTSNTSNIDVSNLPANVVMYDVLMKVDVVLGKDIAKIYIETNNKRFILK